MLLNLNKELFKANKNKPIPELDQNNRYNKNDMISDLTFNLGLARF